MRGVLPVLAGVIVLLAGYVLTWLIATSSYTYSCRLSLELDSYSCWGLMGLPLAAGIGSMAIGGAAILRGILALPLPKQIRALRSSKITFVLGLLILAGVSILSFQAFVATGFFGMNLATILFLTFVGILVFIGAEWIQIYVHPSRELEDDSSWSNQ